MWLRTRTLSIAAAFLAGAVLGTYAGLLTGLPPLLAHQPDPANQRDDLAALKAAFARPETVPFPANNPYSEDKRALGERLFRDPRLSIDGSLSCASCHDRAQGFADGQARGHGVSGHRLARHTPTLWNSAWAVHVFWDGRAPSLEAQVPGPIESPDEMGQPLKDAVARLAADPGMTLAFAKAFPQVPAVSGENIAKAIATYERTLVSPVTRFDRWVAGDAAALTATEVDGFRLFAGKAGCANCHSGFAFTDQAFHDTGLPGDDRGRGAVLRLDAAEHAFKTPGLREIGRSAPYMHDGSLATLEAVIRHYETGVVERATLSKDLPRGLRLNDRERASLIAFLGTLTSEEDPQPPSRIVAQNGRPATPVVHVTTVSQSEKSFHPAHIAIARGGRLWIVNNDSRTHNIRVFDPALDFDSGAQEPGETVEIAFPQAGSFLLFCGIHPKMELQVEVAQ